MLIFLIYIFSPFKHSWVSPDASIGVFVKDIERKNFKDLHRNRETGETVEHYENLFRDAGIKVPKVGQYEYITELFDFLFQCDN